MLRQQLEKSMLDRNYVQLERDSIQNFYDISSREVNELVSTCAIYHWYYYTCSINETYLCLQELAVSAKDREMELLDDNHRVELRVYQQKVKHLEYEHKNNIKGIIRDGTSALEKEQQDHDSREVHHSIFYFISVTNYYF